MTQRGYFSWCDASTHFKPLANRRLEVVEVAGMHARRLPRLNLHKYLSRLRPPFRFNRSAFQPQLLQFPNEGVETIHNLRFAIVKKAVTDRGKS